MVEELCANGCPRKRAPRYRVCQRCRHGAPVPCPSCDGLKRPSSLVCVSCYTSYAKGPNHSCWKGGRILDGAGYVRIYMPEDDRANCGRYMKEHIVVMESTLGRRLLKPESVHHKNGDRTDNRPDNLELWAKGQPAGQRVEDKVKWAVELLRLYAPEVLL